MANHHGIGVMWNFQENIHIGVIQCIFYVTNGCHCSEHACYRQSSCQCKPLIPVRNHHTELHTNLNHTIEILICLEAIDTNVTEGFKRSSGYKGVQSNLSWKEFYNFRPCHTLSSLYAILLMYNCSLTDVFSFACLYLSLSLSMSLSLCYTLCNIKNVRHCECYFCTSQYVRCSVHSYSWVLAYTRKRFFLSSIA